MIQEGATFQQYALACARAFGALVTMRDDPSDAPIPDKFDPDDHHTKGIKAAKSKLERLRKMSDLAKAKACAKSNATVKKEHEASVKRNTETRAKYEAMLEKAKAYKAPTPEHEEYRSFMINQIEESIAFDCHEREAPKPLTVWQWYKSELDAEQWSLKYHTKEQRAEVERANSRTAWVRELKKSLEL